MRTVLVDRLVPGWAVRGVAAADVPGVRAVVAAAAAPGDAEAAHDEAAADVAATGPSAGVDVDAGPEVGAGVEAEDEVGDGRMAQLGEGNFGAGY